MSASALVNGYVAQALHAAQQQGIPDVVVARALIDRAIGIYKQTRTAEDIAAELDFLAQNLDDDQRHAFMRP